MIASEADGWPLKRRTKRHTLFPNIISTSHICLFSHDMHHIMPHHLHAGNHLFFSTFKPFGLVEIHHIMPHHLHVGNHLASNSFLFLKCSYGFVPKKILNLSSENTTRGFNQKYCAYRQHINPVVMSIYLV